MISGILGDVKLGVVLLLKRPAASALIITLLAAGVAGNTAMFTLFSGLFLEPLPFPAPERLVHLDETAPEWGRERVSMSYPDFDAWRAGNRTFEAMAVYRGDSFNFGASGTPRRVKVARVSHDLAQVLRIEPLLGRAFTSEEDRPGGAKLALLGEAFWRDHFGADPDVLGTVVSLHGEPTTVVGVLPRRADVIEEADLWIPLATDVDTNPDAWYLRGIGRLRDGVTIDEAQLDLARVHERVGESLPLHANTVPVVVPLHDHFVGEYRQGTLALFAAVGLVLALTCANVSGLILVRALSRRREVGIRLALGATRGRVLRQLLTESLILAMLGGTLGAVAGATAIDLAVSRMPHDLPRWLSFELDLRFVAFTAFITLATALASGLLPGLSAAKTDLQQTLRASTGGTAGGGSRRRLAALVTLEVALTTTLLVATVFVTSSLGDVLRVEPGYHVESVLTYRVTFPESRYPEAVERRRFIDQHLEAVRGLAEVVQSGAVNTAPLGPHEGTLIEVDDGEPMDADAPSPAVLTRIATPEYFQAMGVVMRTGRPPETDAEVAVNEAFAHRFWPSSTPEATIGRRLRSRGADEWLTIVGVAKDIRHYGLQTPMRAGIYLPHERYTPRMMTFVARVRSEPAALAASVRESIARLDPELPIYGMRTMQERLDASLWPQRAASWLVTVFSTFALGLALTGIYGIVSFAVSEREKELGIRVALGARKAQLLRLVGREGMRPVAVGIAIGLGLSAALSSTLSAFLFDVSATDPRVYAGVAGALLTLASLASLIPSARAATTDPVLALRRE